MKPFEVGKIYSTGNKKQVKILDTNAALFPGRTVMGAILNDKNQVTEAVYYYPDGKVGYHHPKETSKYDLIPEKEEITFWVGFVQDTVTKEWRPYATSPVEEVLIQLNIRQRKKITITLDE